MIAIASDSAGFDLKELIKEHLQQKGIQLLDCGTSNKTESCDYPDFAKAACEQVKNKTCELAILICGTGIGMSICANKIKGIRCGLCSDTFSARMTRLHNDANALAIGARVIGEGLALDIVDAFIATQFSDVLRHKKRVEKITKLENDG